MKLNICVHGVWVVGQTIVGSHIYPQLLEILLLLLYFGFAHFYL